MRAERFDLLVVGGGVTGCGVALDAAAWGWSVALVEAEDFASGTSSKSSKLVHGGLRYLQQGEVGLVYEALAERQRLLQNAPHLVEVLPFLIPVHTKNGLMPRRVARAFGGALWGYDLTGGLRVGKRHERIDRNEARAKWPTLKIDRLARAYLYYDARADDARLTLALARTAALDFGAVAVNRARVVGFEHSRYGRITGAVVDIDGEEIRVDAGAVVNATGVWADEVRALDERTRPDSIRPAKGVHITVPWSRVRNEIAAVIPVPADKRSVFVVPWGEYCYVGTTDTDYEGDLDRPTCTAADVAYLLGALNGVLVEPVGSDEVTGTWAGLRPLVKSGGSARTSDLSRRHSVHRSDSGVVTVTGGKLTTYRAMAADAVDEVAEMYGRRSGSPTRQLRLHGAPSKDQVTPGGHLGRRYGIEIVELERLIAIDPSLSQPLVPGLPYLRAEAVWAVRSEMAHDLFDVLDRRTRCRLLNRRVTHDAAADVGALIARELGWDMARYAAEVARYRAELVAEGEATGDAVDSPRDAGQRV